MSYRKVIKSKLGTNSYQTWKDKAFEDKVIESQSPEDLPTELLKAEPDLMAFKEPATSEELEAVLAMLNDGGLTHLTAIQQKVFQLSVVEGLSNRQVANKLDIDERGVRQHVELIGRKLRALAEKYL